MAQPTADEFGADGAGSVVLVYLLFFVLLPVCSFAVFLATVKWRYLFITLAFLSAGLAPKISHWVILKANGLDDRIYFQKGYVDVLKKGPIEFDRVNSRGLIDSLAPIYYTALHHGEKAKEARFYIDAVFLDNVPDHQSEKCPTEIGPTGLLRILIEKEKLGICPTLTDNNAIFYVSPANVASEVRILCKDARDKAGLRNWCTMSFGHAHMGISMMFVKEELVDWQLLRDQVILVLDQSFVAQKFQ